MLQSNETVAVVAVEGEVELVFEYLEVQSCGPEPVEIALLIFEGAHAAYKRKPAVLAGPLERIRPQLACERVLSVGRGRHLQGELGRFGRSHPRHAAAPLVARETAGKRRREVGVDVPVPVFILETSGGNHVLSEAYGPASEREITCEVVKPVGRVRTAEVPVGPGVVAAALQPVVGYSPGKVFRQGTFEE